MSVNSDYNQLNNKEDLKNEIQLKSDENNTDNVNEKNISNDDSLHDDKQQLEKL